MGLRRGQDLFEYINAITNYTMALNKLYREHLYNQQALVLNKTPQTNTHNFLKHNTKNIRNSDIIYNQYLMDENEVLEVIKKILLTIKDSLINNLHIYLYL